MGVRGEHLEAIARELDKLRRQYKILIMLQFVNLTAEWGSEHDSERLLEVFASLYLDKGDYTFEDLKAAVSKVKLTLSPNTNKLVKELLNHLADELLS